MKSLLKTTLWSVLFFIAANANASLVCPPDKYLKCDDDISDLTLTGKPTLFGSHQYLTPMYEDQFYTNACNVGHVLRKWFLDLNHNYQADQNEPTCWQNIYLSENNYGSIIVKFPKDIVVNCTDDIPYMKPEITSRPCDLMGVSYRDEVYELLGSAEEGCKKILRKFTVINWCDYTPNSPFGGSVWYGTQVIKVIDKEKPVLTACKDVTIGFNEGCKSRVTLTNNAIDPGACTSEKMSWIVEVDLWGDLKIDYVYSNIGSGSFFLPLQKVGQELKITLPDLIGYGKHKVTWRVKDACGNLTSCTTNFTTMDNKPPTPYCVQNVSVALDGKDPWKLKVPASMFSLGATDNCTATQFIKYSFSPDPADSMRFYDCTNAGFQYLTVYATDLMGNKDFCAVYLTVYDNGSCVNTLTAAGKVKQPSGKKVMAGSMTMQGNGGGFNVYGKIEDGAFFFKDVAIYNDMKFIPGKTGLEDAEIDVADYDYFKRYLAGNDTLSHLGMLVADINDDKKVNARDFLLLKEYILKGKKSFGKEDWRFLPSYIKENDISLATYNPVYDAKKFNGVLDFTAVGKGDLTETLPLVAESRQSTGISFLLGDKEVRNGQFVYPVYANKAMDISSALFSIGTGLDKLTDLHPAIETAELNGYTSHLMIAESVNIPQGQPLFYLAMENNYPIHLSGSIVTSGSRSIETINQVLQSTGQRSNIFPNPSQDRFQLSGPVGSMYSIQSINGKSIAKGLLNGVEVFDVSQWPNGLYLVIVQTGDKQETHKFIKM